MKEQYQVILLENGIEKVINTTDTEAQCLDFIKNYLELATKDVMLPYIKRQPNLTIRKIWTN